MECAVSPDEVSATVRARVSAYWRRLGLKDPVLIDGLSHDCLQRARRLVVKDDLDALLRRAIEEAQRRFDHALASAMELPPSNDPQPLATARAALLLSGEGAETLFRHDESTRQLKERLSARLPMPIPPEAPRTMRPVAIDFWLFDSATH